MPRFNLPDSKAAGRATRTGRGVPGPAHVRKVDAKPRAAPLG